jgi:hypothetical protein
MDICAITVLLFSIPISSLYAHYTTSTITPFHDKYIYIYIYIWDNIGYYIKSNEIQNKNMLQCYSIHPLVLSMVCPHAHLTTYGYTFN